MQWILPFVVPFLLPFSGAGEATPAERPDIRPEARFLRDLKGGEVELVLSVSIPEGAYIYRDMTTFSIKNRGEFILVRSSFPEPERFLDPISGMEKDVYRGGKEFTLIARRVESGRGGNLHLEFGYQVCLKNICFFPEKVTLQVPVPAGQPPTSLETKKGGIDLKAMDMEKAGGRGLLLLLLVTFFGGVLTSFTPCIYPIIPVTISVIGARSAGSKMKGFFLSLVYVAGISVTYTALGLAAAFTGSMFGALLQMPAITWGVSFIFFVMGLSMLGLFELAIPSSIATRITPRKRGSGLIYPFVVGLVAGLVVSPCVGPLIISLLTYIAREGSLLKGGVLMFTFSMGMGLLLIVIGTFTGLLSNLPKSGAWMVSIRNLFGIVLIGASLYFLKSAAPLYLMNILGGLFLITLGSYLTLLASKSVAISVLIRAGGIAVIVLGGLYFVQGIILTGGTEINPLQGIVSGDREDGEAFRWEEDEERALARSRREGKPLMIDFWASWCVACLKFDHTTFRDERVARLLKEEFILLKVDATTGTEGVERLLSRYGVMGLPTLIFVSPEGRILEDSRVTGFLDGDEFLPVLERVLSPVSTGVVEEEDEEGDG